MVHLERHPTIFVQRTILYRPSLLLRVSPPDKSSECRLWASCNLARLRTRTRRPTFNTQWLAVLVVVAAAVVLLALLLGQLVSFDLLVLATRPLFDALGFILLLAAYAIVRLVFRGREFFARAAVVTYLVPGSLLFIPMFQVIYSLGLIDNIVGLMVTYLTFTVPFSNFTSTSSWTMN